MNNQLLALDFVFSNGVWTKTLGNKTITIIPESMTVIISYPETFAVVDIRYSGIVSPEVLLAIISEAML